MSNATVVTQEAVERLFQGLKDDAEASGYHLNPDAAFTKELVKGLLVNEHRYGYRACPCRLAVGEKGEDIDIICPCDYRDPDLNEYDACYCALYVTQVVVDGEKTIRPIPERRPPLEERKKPKPKIGTVDLSSLTLPVWRCRVCGYLCAREEPPAVCPICKAEKERFERFI